MNVLCYPVSQHAETGLRRLIVAGIDVLNENTANCLGGE